MDPLSALIFAAVVATMVVGGWWSAGSDQAAAERKTIGEAIVAELAARRGEMAARIRARLEEGYRAGPVYPMWWAWAAVRTAGTVRRVMRQRKPVRRIARASWRGARFAWQYARENRDERGRPLPLTVALCEKCGMPAAVTALEYAETRDGLELRMCALCRWNEKEGRPVPDDQPSPGQPGDERPESAVPAPEPACRPVCTGCGKPLTGNGCEYQDCPLSPLYMPPPRGSLPLAEYPDAWRLPLRLCPCCRTQLMPGTWCAVNATNADICLFCALGRRDGVPGLPEGAWRERSVIELAPLGEPLDAGGSPVAVPRSTRMRIAAEAHRIALEAAGKAQDSPPGATPAGPQALPAITTGNSEGEPMSCTGEVHTQHDWGEQSGAIAGGLADITASAENALRCLDAREAGRGHMMAVKAWSDRVASCMGTGQAVISEVNARQDPYVGAVQAAGGSAEVAQPVFYDEM